ncbi:hypothetical protein [Dethiothermospora halolimnae]|uniref:hypothetical protein n=1 Tax=Dethiothermospora halolimnae TaxID=3114390 RepID=UPI003CCC13D9
MKRHLLFMNAYERTLKDFIDNYTEGQEVKSTYKKLIVLGVKAIKSHKLKFYSKEEAIETFNFISTVSSLIGSLTPKEFENLFPIEKDYDGAKYEVKDYFYTKEYLRKLDEDKPISEQTDTQEFLYEYHNWDIGLFVVNTMSCMSSIREFEGKMSLMEEFAEDMGIKTYTLHKDGNGKEFLFDKETNKTIRVSRPKRLKVVKGGQ